MAKTQKTPKKSPKTAVKAVKKISSKKTAVPVAEPPKAVVIDKPKVIVFNSANRVMDFPVVHMACRRGNNRTTHGQSCNNMRVYNKTPRGGKNSVFQCTKCGFEWTVPTGGTFNMI